MSKKLRGEGYEASRIKQNLGNKNDLVMISKNRIRTMFGPCLTHNELRSIISIVSNQLGLKMNRDAKRNKSMLYLWIEANWTALEPELKKVHIFNCDWTKLPIEK